MSDGQRVGLIFGGRSVEHRVSVASARTVARGLEDAGHTVVPLGVAEDGCWVERAVGQRALDGELVALPSPGGPVAPTLVRLIDDPPDVLFPIVHGTWGEDGTMQGLCETLDLPYVGADVTTSALAMDKIACKRALVMADVPVVEGMGVWRQHYAMDPDGFLDAVEGLPGPPWFVKPAVGGSSVGVRKVATRDAVAEAVEFALRFDDAVLVERAVLGREIECAVLGYEELEASVLGEIVPGAEFYDYADKYLTDAAELLAPAELPEELSDHVREMALEAFAAIGGTGMARVDFLLEGEGEAAAAYVNEINTLPGFTSISMYPRLWAETGVPLPELVDRLVRIAVQRHEDRHRLDAGIKAFLGSLED